MKTLEHVFQILMIILSGIGVAINVLMFKDIRSLLYFTIISNSVIFIWYLATYILKLTNKLKKNNTYYMLKGLVLISIICTMLVFNIFIGDTATVYINHQFECNMVHLIVPSLTLIEWLLFEDKGNLKYKHIFLWAGCLLTYTIFIYVLHGFGVTFLNNDMYPYEFQNIEKHGMLRVVLFNILIGACYIALSGMLVFLDNNIKGTKKKRKKKSIEE